MVFLRRFKPTCRRISNKKLMVLVLLSFAYLLGCFVSYIVYVTSMTRPVETCDTIAIQRQSEVKDSNSKGKSPAKVGVITENNDSSKLSNQSLMPKGITTAQPSIDMTNDYYPFVDFKFVFPEISPNVDHTANIFIIVLVNSGANGNKFRKNREAIRQTWANQSNCEQRKALGDKRLKDLMWILAFVVGKAGAGRNDESNMAEARQHNDMLIGNITDTYLNNIVKLYMGLLWARRFDAKYILKADDDVYVRLPRVMEYLVNAEFPRSFYGGAIIPRIRVQRRIGGRHTISWKYYGETHLPKFVAGCFIVLSSDLLNKLFNHVYKRKPFHVDDAYVGLALHDLGVNVTEISSFIFKGISKTNYRNMTDCKILSLDAFGHKIDPEFSRYLHDRIKRLSCGRMQIQC